jgi:hypothetical protein
MAATCVEAGACAARAGRSNPASSQAGQNTIEHGTGRRIVGGVAMAGRPDAADLRMPAMQGSAQPQACVADAPTDPALWGN